MKINQVLVESTAATVAFAFGRFNPAHQGHIEVWRTVEQAGANWFIGTNATTIGPNDPLTFEQKSAWMEEIYPPIAGHIVPEQTVLSLAAYIFKKVRKNERATVAYITDANDWAWSGKLLNQYNGKEGAHGYYKFAEIIHVPSPRVSSATALRDAARADDKVAFYHASGTDPKAKVAGLTYFDTVKQACEKYPLPVKKSKKVKEGVAEGLNEFAPSPGFGGDDDDDKYTPQDFGKPFKANYLGQNKFEVFCRKPQDPSNVIKLNAEVQKYGLEWEENFGFWFLDSPGAVYLSWKYGEIPLPKAIDQARNPGHIHDLVTDYLTNSPHAAEIQKIATEYFGFTMDGDMDEGLDEHIVKVAGGWELKSKHGDKNLGKYPTKAGAEKRERQVQYFKHMGEDEQQTVAKTWDQMTAQEKISGVKGRTVWNEKTQRYYTVFDVPVKQTTDEASLATMRDYFAGDKDAHDPLEITKQRLHFSKDKNLNPTIHKNFRSKWDYEQWLKQNKLQQISDANESTNDKGWSLINKSKS